MNCPFCGYDMKTDDRYGCPNCNGGGCSPMTPAERKRQQRQRDRAAGLVEVLVKVPRDRSREIRAIADQMRQSDAPPQD